MTPTLSRTQHNLHETPNNTVTVLVMKVQGGAVNMKMWTAHWTMSDNIETLQRLNERLDGENSSLDGIQNAWSADYRNSEENTFTLASSLGCKICQQYHQNPTVHSLEFPLRIDGKTYEYYTVCPQAEEPLFLTEDASYPRMQDVDPEDIPDQES